MTLDFRKRKGEALALKNGFVVVIAAIALLLSGCSIDQSPTTEKIEALKILAGYGIDSDSVHNDLAKQEIIRIARNNGASNHAKTGMLFFDYRTLYSSGFDIRSHIVDNDKVEVRIVSEGIELVYVGQEVDKSSKQGRKDSWNEFRANLAQAIWYARADIRPSNK